MSEPKDHVLPRYRHYEDGDMIQFGPNCLISVEKVRKLADDGGIVAREFYRWIDDLRKYWEAR